LEKAALSAGSSEAVLKWSSSEWRVAYSLAIALKSEVHEKPLAHMPAKATADAARRGEQTPVRSSV